MAERETSRSIDAAAAAWVAREDRGPLSRQEQQTLDDWLKGDPRRAGALLRARAISLRSESAAALGAGYDPGNFRTSAAPPPSRRRFLAWGTGVAASAAAAAVIGVAVLRAPQAHATERGEVRRIPLADGSTVLLNTETRVRVKYGEARRYARLVNGEADFTVLADPGRPFVVEAGPCRLETGGGTFRVRMLPDAPIDILVRQGTVDLVRADAGRPVALGANMRLVLPDEGRGAGGLVAPEVVTPALVTREMAWRDGNIAFEGESLAEAAAAFARYSDTRVVIEDRDLAREPVTGLFAANDPAGFGQAVAGLFGATAVRRGETIILIRTRPA